MCQNLVSKSCLCYSVYTMRMIANYIKHHSTIRVAAYQHGQFFTEYYLDSEKDLLLHVNQHGYIYFRQPVDFPESCSTDRRKTHYVTAHEGFAYNQRPEQLNQYPYCVYRSQNHVFYYDDTNYLHRLMQHVESPAIGRTYIDEYDIGYTEDDTLQTAFDRARVTARCILRLQLANSRPVKEFPTF